MNGQEVLELLLKLENHEIDAKTAFSTLKGMPFEDIGYANIDHHRGIRQGTCEVIYGEGKTAEQIKGILERMLLRGERDVLITRLSSEKAALIEKTIPLTYHPEARIGIANETLQKDHIGNIVVATGGTSDIPIAEEAAITAQTLGNNVVKLYDVGVSGIHRLLSRHDVLIKAKVIIVVAGMEGALASVIGGLVDCPVIAVPTSVGYGAAFNGVAALLSMLNSCASGVTVVNIDNGFGAGYSASMINHIGE